MPLLRLRRHQLMAQAQRIRGPQAQSSPRADRAPRSPLNDYRTRAGGIHLRASYRNEGKTKAGKPHLTAVIKYLERTDNNIMRFPILKEVRE